MLPRVHTPVRGAGHRLAYRAPSSNTDRCEAVRSHAKRLLPFLLTMGTRLPGSCLKPLLLRTAAMSDRRILRKTSREHDTEVKTCEAEYLRLTRSSNKSLHGRRVRIKNVWLSCGFARMDHPPVLQQAEQGS